MFVFLSSGDFTIIKTLHLHFYDRQSIHFYSRPVTINLNVLLAVKYIYQYNKMPLKYKIKKCETVKQVMTEFEEVGFRNLKKMLAEDELLIFVVTIFNIHVK